MASVKVAVRVRPFNQRELDMDAKLIIKVDEKKTRILNYKVAQGKDGDLGRERYKDFTFDHSYWSFDEADPLFASQEKVFEDLGTDVVDSAFQGYNACVFAYGQTGSGKTYTMMGSPECQGLIPRICKTMFNRMSAGKEQGASYRTEVSYLEIYNERVKDLLQPGASTNHSLRVREHPVQGPYVQDLSYHLVTDYEHIREVMLRGNLQRTTASTNMNDVSSRSHAIFTITFAQAGFNTDMMPSETVSKVHLVDLAGSERADTSGATGQRLKEGGHINKSLVTLGSVISALAELSANSASKRPAFIPYRDSVLTWLLKDSLGGNSKTIMIAAISPADCNYGETLSTLRYANRAKNIINKPTINEDPNVKVIRELREEISKLKSLLGDEFTHVLQQRLHEKQAEEKVLTEQWTEKWRETQQILQEQTALGLRKAGTGVVLDSDMPHLVGMVDDDLLSTGVTLYHLKDGETLIGTDNASKPQDIILNGTEAEAQHCRVVLTNGVATLIPQPNAQCWVNGTQIDKPTKLSQGCIIVLGTNVFRYNDPVEAAKMRKEGSRSQLNLSRLSLLSWSTPDLALSSENIYSFSEDPEEAEELESERATLLREKESFKREQTEKQLDWELKQQKRRESLEIAQKELDSERQKMEEEYALQCRRLAQDWCRLEKHQQESLATLRERRAELNEHLLALQSEQSKEKAEIENECRQVEALKTELDLKRQHFEEFVSTMAAQLPWAKGTNGQTLMEHNIQTLQSVAAEKYLSEKPSLTSDSSSESYASLAHEVDSVREIFNHQRQELINLETELRSHELSVAEKSANLTKLETAIVDAAGSLQADTREIEVMKETLAQRTEQQLQELSQKKQSLSLDLKQIITLTKPDSDDSSELLLSPTRTSCTLSSSLGTADTFHTANSLCTDGTAKPNESENLPKLNIDVASNASYYPAECNCAALDSKCGNVASDESDMSSSEDCLKRVGHISPLTEHNCNTPRRTRGHQNKFTRSSGNIVGDTSGLSASQSMHTMKRLCQSVTHQKMLIMQSLENDCDKAELDAQIAVLQDLQRQYVTMEVYLGQNPQHPLTLENIGSSEDSDDVSTSADDGLLEMLRDANSFKLDNDNSSSADGPFSPMSEMSTYTMLSVSPSSQDTGRTGYASERQELVSLPSYVLRGTGGQTHYEYEVRVVCCSGENWCLLRRYKRFRELHLTMRLRYGSQVEALPFPPRVFFSRNSESLARQRRHDLEVYLQQLLDVCSRIPSCPLYSCRGNLTKLALLEFSAFFRKGVFETGKYSTS